jgi:site-specific recombinase XerD
MPNPGRRERDDHGNTILTGTAAAALDELGPRVGQDYRTFKRKYVKWLLTRGKNPRRRQGYADTTVKSKSEKLDYAFRWKWDDYDGYTTTFTPEDADRFIKYLDWDRDLADTSINIYVRALKSLFKYRRNIHDEDVKWDCGLKLSQQTVNVRDFFRKDELDRLYETALEYGTVRHYNACSSQERAEMQNHLARRLSIPAEDVGKQEFMEANSWKIPSLIGVAIDTGMRPIEVKRSTVSWFEPVLGGKREMRIPKSESSKNQNNWRPSLSRRTANAMRLWLDERDAIDRYTDSDAVWLTKFGNPYESNSLNTVLDGLLDEAGIDPRGRELSWYCIRHGSATMWANEHGLHVAKEQMRHNSIETTIGYVHSSVEERAKAMDSFW